MYRPPHAFSAAPVAPVPAPAPAFFFFAFLAFLSLFFRPAIMPTLHTSAYFEKNNSISSGMTIVLAFTFAVLPLLPLPSVARTISGSGSDTFRSARSSCAGFDVAVAEGVNSAGWYVTGKRIC